MDIILDESIVLKDSGYKIRDAVRIIIFDNENNIALYGSQYMLLPGGGIEENEDILTACIRECKEEIGCAIRNITNMGVSREIKSGKLLIQNAHYFQAYIDGEKGIPITQQQNEIDRKIIWVSLDEAISLIESYIPTIPDLSYHSRFNIYANVHFLKTYKLAIKS